MDDEKDYLGTKIWGSKKEKLVRKNLLGKASNKLNIILVVSALWIFLITYGTGKSPPAAVFDFFSNNKTIWLYFIFVYLISFIFLTLFNKLKKNRTKKLSMSENNEEIKEMYLDQLLLTCLVCMLILGPIFYAMTFEYFTNVLFPNIGSKYNTCRWAFIKIDFNLGWFFKCLTS